jgi:hypothetical protein
MAIDGPNLKIIHLGFLRKQDSFLKKSRVMQGVLHNCYDPRLREAEKTGKSWVDLSPFPPDRPLLDYPSSLLPQIVKPWLQARGYSV